MLVQKKVFGHRNLKLILKAFLGKQHYIALYNMLRKYPDFWHVLYRYLTDNGEYPYRVCIRTNHGLISPTIYSCFDLLTVNEIFCRLDYKVKPDIKVIVDLGSNIGISALYFMTSSLQAKCYLYEPDLRNTAKLKHNLSGYEERFTLTEKAVSAQSGTVRFGVEKTGRYGGIDAEYDEIIMVDCLAINDILGEILDIEGQIDVLKVDTEGVEELTVNAIYKSHLEKINVIFLEARPSYKIHPDIFQQNQYGSVCQLLNRRLIRT